MPLETGGYDAEDTSRRRQLVATFGLPFEAFMLLWRRAARPEAILLAGRG